jgi:hypothetical protein
VKMTPRPLPTPGSILRVFFGQLGMTGKVAGLIFIPVSFAQEEKQANCRVEEKGVDDRE